jgi:hypothetical protein
MVETAQRSGRCLCGAISFTFKPAEPEVDACHCRMCQRWGGGPAMTIRAAGPASIEGGDSLAVFASSDWGQRQFCKTCGTHLFFAAPSANYFGVSAGAVDDLAGLAFTTEIFIDCKPDLYDFANKTRRLTEAEFNALLAGSQSSE